MNCPSCGAKLPSIRIPTGIDQLLAGGWRCETCGAEISRTGKIIKDGKKSCPRCAEKIPIPALICRYCGYEFEKK